MIIKLTKKSYISKGTYIQKNFDAMTISQMSLRQSNLTNGAELPFCKGVKKWDSGSVLTRLLAKFLIMRHQYLENDHKIIVRDFVNTTPILWYWLH
jgi:hypothetical protein